MAFATPRPSFPLPIPYPAPCCLTRSHDAYHLARAAAAMARPGTIVDVGCGTGGVAISLLRARPDVRVVGIEVVPDHAREASTRASVLGLGDRLHVVPGDALSVPLPDAPSVVVNPPMLPTEPWFVAPCGDGPPELFAHALLRRLADNKTTGNIWLHAFDFLGLDSPTGASPSLARIAADVGFELSYPHRGWRAVGPTSAIRDALPALSRLFPEALAWADGRQRRFAELKRADSPDLLIRHSIVRLNRPALVPGDLR